MNMEDIYYILIVAPMKEAIKSMTVSTPFIDFPRDLSYTEDDEFDETDDDTKIGFQHNGKTV